MALSPWDATGVIAGVAALVVGAGAVMVNARRARSSLRREVTGEEPTSPDRRQLLARGVLVAGSAALVGVVASAVGYLSDALGGPGGRRYPVGSPEQLRQRLTAHRSQPYVYDPSAGFYVVAFPAEALPAARQVYPADELVGMRTGFVALDQRCPHLGCRVPYCASSGWFECPCHGSRFDRVGELRRGPAPRGLDRYEVDLVDGQVVVDTARKVLGPPPGVDTTHQPAEGPHCR